MSDCINRTKARTILGYSGSTPTDSNEFVTKEQCITMGADSSPLEKYKSDKELVNLDDVVKKNPDYLMFKFEPKGAAYDEFLNQHKDDFILNKGAVEKIVVDYLTGYFNIICSQDVEWVTTNPDGGSVNVIDKVIQSNWIPGSIFRFMATAMINGEVFCTFHIDIKSVK